MEGRLGALVHEYTGYDSVLLCNFTIVSEQFATSTLRVVE